MKREINLLSDYFNELVGVISEKELLLNKNLAEKICHTLSFINMKKEA